MNRCVRAKTLINATETPRIALCRRYKSFHVLLPFRHKVDDAIIYDPEGPFRNGYGLDAVSKKY